MLRDVLMTGVHRLTLTDDISARTVRCIGMGSIPSGDRIPGVAVCPTTTLKSTNELTDDRSASPPSMECEQSTTRRSCSACEIRE